MNHQPASPYARSYEWVCIVVMLLTLLSLGFICLYLVTSAFAIDAATGIRSTAGILLPLVIGGFLAVFRRGLFAGASALRPPLAFALALAFGVVIMLLLRNIDSLRFAPVAELVIAAGLTILLYAPGSMPGIIRETARNDVWQAYYFGVATGMLGYIVLVGFPFVR